MQNATDFLIQSLIGIFLYIVLLRFWMQWTRTDFRNELGQFIIVVTNPFVMPMRKLLPSIGKIDTATVLLALIVAAIKIVAYLLIRGNTTTPLWYLLMSFGLFIKASIYLFSIAILVGIIASWLSPHSYHPVINVARSIGEPLLAPARRLIPNIAGLDFSPMVVMLFLQFSLYIVWEYLLPLPV